DYYCATRYGSGNIWQYIF
nr:immunoglobulin light chain junction region [Macaca mulatta]MOX16953.1 immunoglobulin light chain junction region [Macaca mulatta]MOX17201.1 immunoglobulin light chain junction region [Macaca mulatta]MOX17214.1 immunoglobulin light chain junction region [Macaca mulatta]MOX17315.1 immunoglobulin light chain junction region [Macaca mulatta]